MGVLAEDSYERLERKEVRWWNSRRGEWVEVERTNEVASSNPRSRSAECVRTFPVLYWVTLCCVCYPPKGQSCQLPEGEDVSYAYLFAFLAFTIGATSLWYVDLFLHASAKSPLKSTSTPWQWWPACSTIQISLCLVVEGCNCSRVLLFSYPEPYCTLDDVLEGRIMLTILAIYCFAMADG